MKQVPAETAAMVAAVVLFGDPDNGQPVQGVDAGNVITFCHDGDLICKGQPVVLPAHLTYGINGPAAAQFVAGKVLV